MNEARRIYHINSSDTNEINYILDQIAERLDQMEGYRGNPEFKADINFGGNKGTNAGTALGLSDVATLGNVSTETNALISPITTLIVNIVYPVGAMLMTTKSANPSTYLGGTWESVSIGTFGTIINTDEIIYVYRRTA